MKPFQPETIEAYHEEVASNRKKWCERNYKKCEYCEATWCRYSPNFYGERNEYLQTTACLQDAKDTKKTA